MARFACFTLMTLVWAGCSKDQLAPRPPEDACAPRDLRVIGSVPECAPREVGTFTPEVEWHWEPDGSLSDHSSMMMTPVVISVNDDNADGVVDLRDTPDVIAVMYQGTAYTVAGVLRVISGDGSAEHWNVPNLVAGGSGVAAGDIDNDGFVEIVATTTNRQVVVLEHDGTLKWQGVESTLGYVPTIADLNSDGFPEVICAGHVYSAQGNLLWSAAPQPGFAVTWTPSVAADVDGDGFLELFMQGTAWSDQGDLLWNSGSFTSFGAGTAVGDLNRDGAVEVVFSNGNGLVRAVDALTGTVLWEYAGLTRGGPPTIADFDSDGLAEVGIASRDRYTVLDSDGTLLWSRDIQDESSGATGSSVFDFEGDGEAEVIMADETSVWAFAGTDGSVKMEFDPHTSWTLSEYPVIADVDGDGQSEIVIGHSRHASPVITENHGEYYGLTVLGASDGSWMPTRRIWNQHGYNITNVMEDGSIPLYPEPNWVTYNNFRSADVRPRSEGQPDLLIGFRAICADACPQSFDITLAVGNQGYVPVEAGALLEILATFGSEERVIASQRVEQSLAPGEWSQELTFTIDNEIVQGARTLRGRVDGGLEALEYGAYVECDETNNSVNLATPPCNGT